MSHVNFLDFDDKFVIPYGFSFNYGMMNDPSLKGLCEYYRWLCEKSKTASTPQRALIATIKDIPLDCILLIFEFMDASSLCSSQSVCQMWRQHTTNDDYWRHLCIAVFNSSPDSFVYKRQVSSKSVYASMHTTVVDLLYGRNHAVSTNNFVIPRSSVPMLAQY